jgi:hypothetical protein
MPGYVKRMEKWMMPESVMGLSGIMKEEYFKNYLV